MIKINKLTEEDIGRRVIYNPGHGDDKEGVLKSFNNTYCFVVFHCNGEWERYFDYTGCCVNPIDLTFKNEGK